MNDAGEITPNPIIITELVCLRCGGTWIPRSAKMPGYCPKCNSPYWNKQRRVKKSEKKESHIAKFKRPIKKLEKMKNASILRIYVAKQGRDTMNDLLLTHTHMYENTKVYVC